MDKGNARCLKSILKLPLQSCPELHYKYCAHNIVCYIISQFFLFSVTCVMHATCILCLYITLR